MSKLILKKYKWWVPSLGILGTVINIMFFQSTNSPVLIIFLIYWLTAAVICKMDEKFFFILALIFLVLAVTPFLLNHIVLAERLSVWEFLFLSLGIWQFLYLELREKFSKKS